MKSYCLNRILRVYIILAVVILCCFLTLQSKNRVYSDQYRGRSSVESSQSTGCKVKSWNKIDTYSIPNADIHKKWVDQNISRHDNFLLAELRIVSAYVYHDHISVVTTNKNNFGKTVYCRYFDCNRRELVNSTWESYIFPMAVAYCVRRAGAEYVSLTYSKSDESQDPVPLTNRILESPEHELSVCVGPLYGNESKWLEIVEYVEHYRLVGATYFYFTLYNLNEYDRKIVDDYVRLGFAEVHFFQSEYENPGWQFHLLQQSECSQRSKYHSKWVINMDIDERLTPGSNISILNYLRSLPDDIGEVSFSTHRVKKTDVLPKKYINDSQLLSEMEFLKYNETSDLTWYNFKGIVRPEKVEGFFYHWSYAQYPGVKIFNAPSSIGFVRHYRSTDANALNGGWMKLITDFKPTRLETNFENQLKKAVIKRVKYVYNQRTILCEELPGTRYTYFKRELLDCKFKNELTEEERFRMGDIAI